MWIWSHKEKKGAKLQERKNERETERTVETLLHDVLWLMEATFNLPQALVWREREREKGRVERGEMMGGGTDVAEKGENDAQLTVGQNQRRALQILEVSGEGREKRGKNP